MKRGIPKKGNSWEYRKLQKPPKGTKETRRRGSEIAVRLAQEDLPYMERFLHGMYAGKHYKKPR